MLYICNDHLTHHTTPHPHFLPLPQPKMYNGDFVGSWWEGEDKGRGRDGEKGGQGVSTCFHVSLLCDCFRHQVQSINWALISWDHRCLGAAMSMVCWWQPLQNLRPSYMVCWSRVLSLCTALSQGWQWVIVVQRHSNLTTLLSMWQHSLGVWPHCTECHVFACLSSALVWWVSFSSTVDVVYMEQRQCFLQKWYVMECVENI